MISSPDPEIHKHGTKYFIVRYLWLISKMNSEYHLLFITKRTKEKEKTTNLETYRGKNIKVCKPC